jgi:TonB family protein
MTASVAPVNFDPKPVPAAAPPVQPPVITNVFSTPAAAVAAKPTRTTEVAGFGELNPTHDSNRPGKVEVASAAFGDVTGVGDRSTSRSRGGVQGGVVGGFEGGVVGGSRNPTTKGTVTVAGFVASSDAPKVASPSPQRDLDPGRIEKPVEILAKPRPDYTDEARKMRIEGEVLLRVLFTAAGEVRVLEVTRGLGYGLNENATRAAQQIRFKPAQRAGQPVDSTAIVHIVFQLAY